jgi:hypothetical protein
METEKLYHHCLAPNMLCQVAVGKLGYPAAKVARFLGVTTSAVLRSAYSEDLPEMGKNS